MFLKQKANKNEAVQESCEYACVQTEKIAVVCSNSTHRLVGACRS